MNLFESGSQMLLKNSAPLADRMRPQSLDEFVGQEHIIGRGRLLRRAIEIDQLSSIILYGPPGTGKTTLARIIANTTNAEFITINAVLAGVKDIRESIAKATDLFNHYSRKTILFVDEVHRFNKSQQDALLPHVESGTITLIGATTENPYFEVNKALVSRSRIFQLRSLESSDLVSVVHSALANDDRGYGNLNISINADALTHLCDTANGDARTVLNALELAVETTDKDESGKVVLTSEIIEESIQKKAVLYDKDGDAHYDIISAFIKSIRGSDPDASLYWLAKMIYAGEDPRFILRRMVILASEDIGLADPNALTVVMSAVKAYDYIGMPEGRFPLSQACLYLATAPKSNTTLALFDALRTIKDEADGEVPNHLKDSSRDRNGFGHGEGYLYPHAYRDHWVAQQYLPGQLQGKLFYTPSDQGYENQIRIDVERRRETQIAALNDAEESTTFLWQGGSSGNWEQRTGEKRSGYYEIMRDRLFSLAKIESEHLVIDLNCQSGFYTYEAMRRAELGGVWSISHTKTEFETVRQYLKGYAALEAPQLLLYNGRLLQDQIENITGGTTHFDRVIARNFLSTSQWQKDLKCIPNIIGSNGEIHFSELLEFEGSKVSDICDSETLKNIVLQAEEQLLGNQFKRGEKEVILQNFADENGYAISVRKEPILLTNSFTRSTIENWFRNSPDQSSLGDVVELIGGKKERDELYQLLIKTLVQGTFPWHQIVAFIKITNV